MTAQADGDDSGPKGPRFTKVYDRGWERVEQLLTFKGGPTVGRLWLFLVRHAGHDNAVVVTVDTLAESLEVSSRSVMRASKFLQTSKAVEVVKLGTANVYILNPDDVWKSAEINKRFCGFSARAIVGFKENSGLRRRLSHYLPQAELPLEAEEA